MTLLLLATTAGLLVLVRNQPAFGPVRMFLYGWLLVLGTYASGMIRYEHPLELPTFVLVLATLLAFVGGARFAQRSRRPRPQPFGRLRDDFDRLTLSGLCLLALIGAGMVARDFLAAGPLNLGQIRNEFWTAFNAGEIETSPIRSMGIVSSLAVATLLPYAIRHRRRLLAMFAALCAVVVALDAVLSAGRFGLGVLALALLVSTTHVYGSVRMFTVRRALIGAAIGIYFFVIFPTQRNPELATFVERYLWYSGDAYIAEWVKSIVTIPGMAWAEVLAYSTSYFSTSLDKLNHFVTKTDVMGWYKLGLYNVTQISQVMGAVGDSSTPWHQTRLDIAALMRREGWSENPWSTGIRDLGIDFGYFAIIVTGVLGYLAQTAYDKARASRSYVGLIVATYVPIACLIFAFISPFQIRLISNGLWLLAVIAISRFLIAQAVGKSRVSQRFSARL